MKKAFLYLLLLTTSALTSHAQDCGTAFLGTKTLYKAPFVKYTPVPAGYQPVFINHVGRHGARHLTKDVNTTAIYGILLKADSTNMLTDKGRLLKQMVLSLQKVEKGNTKSISAEGRAELKEIGNRMYHNYSNVFARSPKLNVTVTKEIRTKQSADAFLSGLKAGLKDSAQITETNDDLNLRFYDESPAYTAYKDGDDWEKYKAIIVKAEHIDEMNKNITARLFKPDFLKTQDKKWADKIVSDMWGFATIVYSLKEEIGQKNIAPGDLDFTRFFTCEELKALGRADAVEDFLVKGPGIKPNGIQVIIAAPLLANFITTSDDFIKTGPVNANLRFAHAETISPFAALLGIVGADKVSPNINQFDAAWQASNVAPLSSNIQWIFYKKKGSANYLVKVLLNEKEAHITGLKAGFPYYKWADVRKLYVAKLTSLNYKLGDDASAFLKAVK
ncbi:histidine-type phosphatase [Mucilaginibacter ginsenosidivorax]|uniref:Multiple inositol polyphosphate phosphatase 1 n=1 Tax=Mucilaginibacter ginsenosidivorax TaxID=862126 RepID=A0A5B8VW16_9SPHI|nr:histidine-type phosphatase [Mucilaginibacter ginsenosidivorax]QEC75629.1 histidine phosphatase family protein [Mucilaginibacter ginsenosidivorax]